MATKRYKWGDFRVTVRNSGEGVPPWSDRDEPTYRYAITVADNAGHVYRCKAWGSIYDMERGNDQEHKRMGAMVLDELASAYYDPDEFWAMAIGEERPSRERVREVEALLDAAKAFGKSLVDASDILRHRELV